MTNDIKAAAERLRQLRQNDLDCPHIWSAHQNCQWCHQDRSEVEAKLVADAYLALINRTPSESAKAAAEEIQHESIDRLPGAIVSIDMLAAIIQRHMPPVVNERLLLAAVKAHIELSYLIDQTRSRDGGSVCEAYRKLGDAITEARVALEAK